MRDYMIAHYPKFNERVIMRVNEDEVQRLWTKEQWIKEEKWAKRFYKEDDAWWALVLARTKWLKEEQLERPEQPKQSWNEL